MLHSNLKGNDQKGREKKKEEDSTKKRLKNPSSLEKVVIQIVHRVALSLVAPSHWYHQHVGWHVQGSRKVAADTSGLSVEMFEVIAGPQLGLSQVLA